MTTLSTTSIGKAFGGRDHTTVMHGCDKITASMNADFSFRKKVEEIMGLIEGR
jgi:chromosomal replication initiator protein